MSNEQLSGQVGRMSQVSHHASQAGAWLKRFWPVFLLVGACAFVFAMGWQRHLTLEELAARRGELSALIAENPVLSVLAFIGLYAVIVALSLVPSSTRSWLQARSTTVGGLATTGL